ncbi:ABC transporter ATP-binding protein [Pseudothermotoga sp.]|uniref:ABC transporter ATP-binding protein n=1 Tax=Pseudothermotoga sp. TaxID=2033661 RepID=UPI0031F634BA
MAFLELINLTVAYQKNQPVLKNLNLSVQKGEFVSLLGPSGCGKTTTLRVVAGFLKPIEGKVIVDGKNYTNVPPHRRNIGIVFQNYALFPHMNAFENVAFGLRMRRLPKAEIERKVRDALELVGLSGFEDRLPSELSGGQQQRVAIARAIVIEPDLLLMDEPLSNLDANLRAEMRSELRQLQQKLAITTIYVTHDQSEAVALSDRIVVMRDGKIEQVGTPQDVYLSPKTKFVASFMGFQMLATGHVRTIRGNFAEVICSDKSFMARITGEIKPEDRVVLFARPRRMKIVQKESPNSFEVQLLSKLYQGETVLIILKLEERQFSVESDVSSNIPDSSKIFVHVPPEDLLVLREE